VFSVFGNHTYANVGTYQVTVTITNSANGAVAIASSAAVIQPPTLTPVVPQPTVATLERVIFSGPVGEFTDNNPSATASQFSDLIDWGDGSPQSAGTVTLIASSATSTTFEISGTHSYADHFDSTGDTSPDQTSGTFPLLIHVVGTDGSSVDLTNTATVTGGPLVITGHLSSSSDSGISDSDGITDVTQPTFDGLVSEPDARVFLFAQPLGGSPMLIGQGTASPNGDWSITPGIALADGSYTVTATAYDATNGKIVTTGSIFPVVAGSGVLINPTAGTGTAAVGTGPAALVVDNVGPKVTDVVFNRLHGRIVVTFQDFGGVNNTGVGMDLASEIDANNYQLTTVHHPRIGKYRVNVISVVPGTTAGTQTATLTINHGGYIKGGWYFFTVFSTSPTNVTGLQDIAGNGLDGEFYGYFPSGNNVPGGNYVAQLTAIHHTIFAPSTIIGRATPVSPPGTRPGSIHIKQTINPGKLPPSLKGNVADTSKKTEVKLVRHADKAARPSGAKASVAVSTSSAAANGSASIGALSALDTALDQIGKPKHHGS
jgi:Bacterial Ig-like domain